MENSINNERSSIGEDIKILENLKTAIDTGCVNFGGKSMYGCGYQEALEHILSDYKRVQEEFKQVDHECDRLEQKEIKLEKENAQLKEDIKEMYYKEAVITIMCDNFNLSRNEVLELLGDEE